MRYVLDFGSGNSGYTPTFLRFLRLDTLVPVTAPTPISSIGNGLYYFDYDWNAAPAGVTDIVFEALAGTFHQRTVISAADQSLFNTINQIQTSTANLPTNIDVLLTTVGDQLLRILGMLHENSVVDKTVFDPTTNSLVSARFRTYTTKTDAVEARRLSPANYDDGKIAEYAISADYLGPNLLRYLVSKEFPLDVIGV